ncbi:SpoIID/LytB domain-containing protein [Clostridium sp. DL1XJH146]
MKKLLSTIIISIFVFLLIYLFLPRKANNAVIYNISEKKVDLYIDSILKTFVHRNTQISKSDVIDCRYNKFFMYSVKIKDPIKNRIMIKNEKYYEVEKYGNINLAENLYIYSQNDNSIIPSSKNSILVGKGNVDIYLDENNNLDTFIIHPLDYSTMRVAISTDSFQSIYHTTLTIQPSSDCMLYNYQDNLEVNISSNDIIHINSLNGELLISVNNKEYKTGSRVYIENSTFTIKDIQREYPQFNPNYDGCIELFPTINGIIVINEVDLENYLSKVVPSEMPTKGGLEALKCQAVAARTYAISDMLSNRFASLGFYVDDSTKSQVYNNTLTQDLTSKAVTTTKGIIMTYDGSPIDAKYYSTSCGFGTEFQNIWYRKDAPTESIPYLGNNNFLISKISIPNTEQEWLDYFKSTSIESYDSISPYYRWYASYSKDDLEKILYLTLSDKFHSNPDYVKILINKKEKKEFPKDLGALLKIDTIRRSEMGNILELSFLFENAEIIVDKDVNIRRCFNNGNTIVATSISVLKNDGSTIDSWSTLPSSFFSTEILGDTINIYGGGFGHGVGMSQYGAMNLSLKGYSYEDILKLFYKGINIEKIY